MKEVFGLSVLSKSLGTDKEVLLPLLPTGAHTRFLGTLKSHPQLTLALDGGGGEPLKENMIRVRHGKTTGVIHLVVESLSLTDKERCQPRRRSTTVPTSATERIVYESDFVISWTVAQPPTSRHVQKPYYPEPSDGIADTVVEDVLDMALASPASDGGDDTTDDPDSQQQDHDRTTLSTENKQNLDRIASLGLTQFLRSTKPRSLTKQSIYDTHPTDQPTKRPRPSHAPTSSCASPCSGGNDDLVVVQPVLTDASPLSKTTTI